MMTRHNEEPVTQVIPMNGRMYRWNALEGLDPEICLEVEGYIRKRAWGYALRTRLAGLEVEDLVQEGWAGALRAARRFNLQAGAKYLTYAAPWIEAAMKEALSGRHPRTDGFGHPVWIQSLDAPEPWPRAEHGPSLLERQVDATPSPEDILESLESSQHLWKALSRLKPVQRRVVVAHHGLGGQPPRSLPALAKELGTPKAQVVKIYEEAMGRLVQILSEARLW